MGYYERPDGTSVYVPDDDETTLYINSECVGYFHELVTAINAKWPDVDMNEVQICPQYILPECIGYDVYDPGDYTMYYVIKIPTE